ncbi:hypothetical protein, partial [Pseudomonas sp. N8]|uniref:hypothetical protein n=1 Tax=Pseudomonas sp. N8 TaxID=3449428 RepID=UPI003F69A208
ANRGQNYRGWGAAGGGDAPPAGKNPLATKAGGSLNLSKIGTKKGDTRKGVAFFMGAGFA